MVTERVRKIRDITLHYDGIIRRVTCSKSKKEKGFFCLPLDYNILECMNLISPKD